MFKNSSFSEHGFPVLERALFYCFSVTGLSSKKADFSNWQLQQEANSTILEGLSKTETD
jgi:hypothetical protein